MKIIKFIISIAIPLVVGFAGSIFTVSNIPTWYAQINKPSFNPPNWLFSPVWTTLFVLMGISLFIVWISVKNLKAKKMYFVFFAIQLILNFLWSYLFFTLHLVGFAFIEMIALWISILILIIISFRISKASAWLLVPYLLWVSFATFLTYNIWMLNK